MKSTTYNQLTTFHAIVAEGTISGAARKLEVAPASVSQSLKLLEQHLGVPLFTRTTRRIELTQEGTRLFEQTKSALNEIEVAIEGVTDESRKPSGKLSITTPKFAYQLLLQPIYDEFCQTYPDIELEISVSDKAVNIIEQGFDCGIRFGDKIEQGMVARQLTPSMKETLFASPQYLQQFGTPTSLTELQQHRLIQYRFINSNQLAPLHLIENNQQVLVQMPLALICNDTDVMVDAARKGLGIGRIVEPVVVNSFADQSLFPVLEQHWPTYPGLYLYFHQNAQKAKRVRVFIDFLITKARFCYQQS